MNGLDTGDKREGTEGCQERAGGGAHRGDVQDDSINDTARGPVGPHSGDNDTRERKRMETVTVTKEKRYLKKRTQEGGSKGGALATGLDATDD